jgi:hypothetical protein
MAPAEREPAFLAAERYLEKCEDFEYEGRLVQASRLGWRMTERFCRHFFGRVFSNPATVLPEEMLRPEKQDLAVFVDGVDNIVATQQRVARLYFEDGSIEWACPPLRALLHIMAHGQFEGKTAAHPEIRALFTREAMLASPWYHARLASRLRFDVRLRETQVALLERFLANPTYESESWRLGIPARLAAARAALEKARWAEPREISGTLGRDPALD